MKTVIDDSLSEAQLSEIAFTEEIVVVWDQDTGDGPTGGKFYGVITGYDPSGKDGDVGMFVIDLVAPIYADGIVDERPRGPIVNWIDTGSAVPMLRSDFAVFGPANREPGQRATDRPVAHQPGAAGTITGMNPLGKLEPDLQVEPFVRCMRALLMVGMGDFCSNDPTFRVRLDVDAKETPGGYDRKYRILVRPIMVPIMHDEMIALLAIAEQHDLACSIGQAGVQIHRPEDVPTS